MVKLGDSTACGDVTTRQSSEGIETKRSSCVAVAEVATLWLEGESAKPWPSWATQSCRSNRNWRTEFETGWAHLPRNPLLNQMLGAFSPGGTAVTETKIARSKGTKSILSEQR